VGILFKSYPDFCVAREKYSKKSLCFPRKIIPIIYDANAVKTIISMYLSELQKSRDNQYNPEFWIIPASRGNGAPFPFPLVGAYRPTNVVNLR